MCTLRFVSPARSLQIVFAAFFAALIVLIAVSPPGAAAATYPAERTFTGGLGGWTQTTARNCTIVVVTLCTIQNSHSTTAGNPAGSLRTDFSTTAGALGLLTASSTWSSPPFTLPDDAVDSASLSIDRHADVGLLESLLGGAGTYAVLLRDTTTGTTATLLSGNLGNDNGFVTRSAAVPAATLAAGGTYQVQIRTTFQNNGLLTALSANSVLWDNVVLEAAYSAPQVTAPTFTGVTQASATARTNATTGGHATSVSFEYGTTTAYGSTTPAQLIGSGAGAVAVNAPLTGLSADTTYHVRAVATSVAGTVRSADSTFTTLVDAPASTGTGPVVTGTAREGATLTCTPGTFSGAPTFAFAWLRDGVVVDGSSASTYALGAVDVGHVLACRVTATNAGGSTTLTSPATAAVLPAAPTSLTAPGVTGSAVTGQTLTCTPGTWTGAPTFAYAWLRDGGVIAGATASTYVLVDADEGHVVACRVTGTNPGGSASATSAATSTVVPVAPGSLTPPTVSGIAVVGQALTCDLGSWSGSPTFAHAWLRSGAPIAGATTSTYVLVAADEAQTIACRVTATNAGGSTSATSSPTGAVLPLPPAQLTDASVTGTARVGQTLTCNPGTWSGSPTFSYTWLRSGAPITGANAATYVLVAADEGMAIACRVAASNAGGTTVVTTAATAAVLPIAPASLTPPTVTGSAIVGQTLTCNPGTWSGSPTFAYAWLRDGAVIAGATASTYTLTAADEGHAVACRVTGTNVGGSSSATSTASDVVVPVPPTTITDPTLTGDPIVGTTLTCSTGTWSGSPTFTFAWLRDGAVVAGATGSTYLLTAADEGHTIACRVTATNPGGPTTVITDSTDTVVPVAPAATTDPTLTGDPITGRTLTCNRGTWSGSPTFTYAWLRDGVVIAGATASTYTLVTADQGHAVACRVTGTNAGGSASATSAPTPVVTPAPIPAPTNQTLPAISGMEQVGSTLTCNTGAWTGSPTLATSWLRDGAPIGGATGTTYVLVGADAGGHIACRVVATNAGGTATATSAATGAIAPASTPATPAPANVAAPAITYGGRATIGTAFTCDRGTWTNATTLDVSWLRDGTAIPGATATTYTSTGADADTLLACRVTATGAGGTAAASSPSVSITLGSAPLVLPAATTLPSINGTAKVGSTLSCDPGTWTGAPTFAYSWTRDGRPVAGAASARYVLVAADYDTRLRCVVVGSNAQGSSAATSGPTSLIALPDVVHQGSPIPTGAAAAIASGVGDPDTGAGVGGSIIPLAKCTIIGTARADRIIGTNGNDVICGLGGNDVIDGRGGNDVIDGGAGNDRIVGGAGNDTAFGLAGSDKLDGRAGNDRMSGGAGSDVVRGGAGNDVVTGSLGNDLVAGELGNDTVIGRYGNDRLDGGAGNDRVIGNAGNDVLRGGAGNDLLDGGFGNDSLSGDAGTDSLFDRLGRNVFDSGRDGTRDRIVAGLKDRIIGRPGDIVRRL